MKKLICTALTMFTTYFVSAQYDPAALAVLDAVSNKYKSVEVFKASFTQKLTNKQVGLDESSSGDIIVKGDKYVLDIANQKIFNNGTDVYAYSEEISEVTISPYDPEDEEITIGNVYDLYKEGFKYALISTMSNGDRVIELDPESRDKSYFKLKLIINSKDEMKSFTIFERTNNVYTISINSFDEVSVKDQFFYI